VKRIDLRDGFYLDAIRSGDEAAYVEHFGDKDTTNRLLTIPYPYTRKDAETWIESRLRAARNEPIETSFALRRPDGFLIGGTALVMNRGAATDNAELGFWVARSYRRRGLALSMAQAMIVYAFRELELKSLEAVAALDNLTSHTILEKLGFAREDLLVGYHFREGRSVDVYRYSLLNRNGEFLYSRQ
jgi:ribosomal-protein-alanine N-acetyltransferase